MLAKIFIYRIIDICDELDVNRLRRQLKRLKIKPLRARYFAPVYLNFATPPVEMKGRGWVLKPFNFLVGTKVKFYSLGSVTIYYEIILEAPDYSSCFKKAKEVINSPIFERKTLALIKNIRTMVERELGVSTRAELIEDYSILWICDKFQPQKVYLRKIIAQFLRDEALPLSQYEQDEACKYQFSYTPEDLTIIDWDRAVTIGKFSQEDVWDVLEYANLQLLELRYYEMTLERSLEDFYKLFGRPYWKTLIGFYQTTIMLRKLSNLYLEFNEEEKRISGFLRLTGDEYLSRIYTAAAKRLNIESFHSDLKARLADARMLYEMLSSQASSLRMEILEVTIVLLITLSILFEIIK